MTPRLFSLILTLFAIVSNAAFLRYENGPLEIVPRFRRCLSCEDERWGSPPYFYHHHGPHFHSHQWSGMSRSPDGYQQQVFSGAAASADSDTQNSGGSQAFSLASSSAGNNNQYKNTGYKHSQNQDLYSDVGYGNKESSQLSQTSSGNQGIDKQDVGNQQQQKQTGLKQSDYMGHDSGAGFGGKVDSSNYNAASQPLSGTQAINKPDFGIQQQLNHNAGYGNKVNAASQTFGTQGFDKQDTGNQQQQKEFGFKQSEYINHGSGAGLDSNIDSSSTSPGTQAINKPDFGSQQQQQQFSHGSSGSGYGNKENTIAHTFGNQGFDKQDAGNQQQQKQFGFNQSDYTSHGFGAEFGDKTDSSRASSGSQAINRPDFGTQQQKQQFNHESYSGNGHGNKENAPSQTFGTHGFDKQNLGTQQQFGFKHSQNSGAEYNNGRYSGSSSQASSGTQSLRKDNLDNQQQQQQIEEPNSKDFWETIHHQHHGNLNTGSRSNNVNLQSQTPKTNGLHTYGNEQQQLSLGGNGHNKDFSGSNANLGKVDKNTNNLQSTEGYGYGWFVGSQSGKTGSQLNHGTALESEHFGHNQDKTVDSSVAGNEQQPASFGSGSFQSAHNDNWKNTGSLANQETLNDEQQIQQHGAESFGQNQFQANSHSYDKTKSSLSGALSLASQGLQASDNSNTGCSTCSGKELIAYSNAKSHSGSAIALSVGGK